MVEAVKQFVQNVIVIMLLAAFLQLVLPEGGMRRYAQLAVGLIMVLTLLTPLLQLSQTRFDLSELLGQATMRTSLEELKVKGQVWQQQNDQTLLNSYRQALTDQIRQVVEASGEVEVSACDFELVEDREADDFGRIIQMKVSLRWRSDVVQPVSAVRPVQVGDAASESPSTVTPLATERAAELRRVLANHFVLTADHVAVIIK